MLHEQGDIGKKWRNTQIFVSADFKFANSPPPFSETKLRLWMDPNIPAVVLLGTDSCFQ